MRRAYYDSGFSYVTSTLAVTYMFRRNAFDLGSFGHGLVSSVLPSLERLKAAILGDDPGSLGSVSSG